VTQLLADNKQHFVLHSQSTDQMLHRDIWLYLKRTDWNWWSY